MTSLALISLLALGNTDDLGISVAPKVGIAVPTSHLDAAGFAGVEGDYRLPWLDGLLSAGLELGYMAPSESGSASATTVGGNFDYELDQRIVVLTLNGTATYPVGELVPYAGVGYGFYFLKASTTAFGTTTDESQTRAGLHLRGGAGYPLGPGELFGELSYYYTQLRFTATGAASGGGALLGLGYRFRL